MKNIQNINIRYGSGVPVPCDPSLVTLVKITYTDIYEDEHTVYFENGQKCSKDYYDEIVKKSREDFHETCFKMCDLHFDDLKKYCKIRKNYKKGR